MNRFIDQFQLSVRDIADATGGSYKSDRVLTVRRRLSAVEATVSYRGFDIMFYYHAGRGNGPKSVLSFLIRKSDDPFKLGYFVYDILAAADSDDLSCYTFAYLPDPEALEDACNYLRAKLGGIIEIINGIFDDESKYMYLRNGKMRDINEFFGRDMFMQAELMEAEVRERFLSRIYDITYSAAIGRFSSVGYSYFLRGDAYNALKRYVGYRNLTSYEKRLVERLGSDEPPKKPDCPDYLNGGLAAELGKSAFLPRLLGLAAVTSLCFPIYFGIYMLVAVLLSDGALFSTSSALYNAVEAVIPSIVTALCVCFYFRTPIVRLFSRKRRALLARYAAIIDRGRRGHFTKYVISTVSGLCVIFTMLISNHGVRFYGDRMLVNASLTSLRPVEHTYSEIECVYVFEGGYDEYGTFIDEPGTAIVMSGGRVYDFRYTVSNADLEKKVFPAFREYGIKIKYVRSLEDVENGALKN